MPDLSRFKMPRPKLTKTDWNDLLESIESVESAPSGEHGHAIGDVTGLQAALDTKQPTGAYLTAVSWTDVSGKPSAFTPTAHSHVIADVTGLQSALDGKQAAGSYSLASHNHSGVYAPASHSHVIADVTGLQAALDGKQASGSYATTSHNHDGTYATAAHTHTIANVAGLQAALDGKQAAGSYAASSHGHVIADVTGLQAALDGKQASGSYAAASHNHSGVYEPVIAAGTAAQYWRGDKTWQTLPSAGAAPTVYTLGSAHTNSTVTPSTVGSATADADWVHTLVAGKIYRFTIWANYQTAALTTGGRMNLLGAGGLAGTVQGMMWGGIVQAAAASTLEVPIFSFANGTGAFLLTTAVNPINSPHKWGADFVFVCSTGGTLAIQWASEVASSAAQLNAGATMMVELLN